MRQSLILIIGAHSWTMCRLAIQSIAITLARFSII